MNRLLLCLAPIGLVLTALAGPTLADVVSVSASADSTVDFKQPTINLQGDLLARKEGTPEAVADQLTFFYAQFNLPAGLTGQQIQMLNSAQFGVTRTGPNLSLTYHVYGVLDGQDTASADTYTWNGGVGYDPSHTLVKFLGADEISYYSDPAKSAFVGVIDTATPGAGPFNFSSTPQSPTAANNLKNLILDDADGLITFYVGVRQNFGVTGLNTFAARENGNFAGPSLTLDFNRVPEPSTLVLNAVGAAIVLLVRRQRSK